MSNVKSTLEEVLNDFKKEISSCTSIEPLDICQYLKDYDHYVHYVYNCNNFALVPQEYLIFLRQVGRDFRHVDLDMNSYFNRINKATYGLIEPELIKFMSITSNVQGPSSAGVFIELLTNLINTIDAIDDTSYSVNDLMLAF